MPCPQLAHERDGAAVERRQLRVGVPELSRPARRGPPRRRLGHEAEPVRRGECQVRRVVPPQYLCARLVAEQREGREQRKIEALFEDQDGLDAAVGQIQVAHPPSVRPPAHRGNVAHRTLTFEVADKRVGSIEQMRVLMLAPPGGGKGTQGIRLAEHLGVEHISSGDLLRAAVAEQTPLGLQVETYMNAGELAPDALVTEAIRPILQDPRRLRARRVPAPARAGRGRGLRRRGLPRRPARRRQAAPARPRPRGRHGRGDREPAARVRRGHAPAHRSLRATRASCCASTATVPRTRSPPNCASKVS